MATPPDVEFGGSSQEEQTVRHPGAQSFRDNLMITIARRGRATVSDMDVRREQEPENEEILIQYPSIRSLRRWPKREVEEHEEEEEKAKEGAEEREGEEKKDVISASRKASMSELMKGKVVDDHKISMSALADRYQTHIDVGRPSKSRGITAEEAARRLEKNGPNQLTPAKAPPLWTVFVKQLVAPLNAMLIVAGVLSFVIAAIGGKGNYVEPLVLGAVLVLVAFANASLDFTQKIKADKVLNSFGTLLPGRQAVIRAGVKEEIDPTDLVVGDVVLLKAGDKLPADVRFIKVADCKVDNSTLTGESIAKVRKVQCTKEDLLEAENMGFYGTVVVGGSGHAVVVRTGDSTVLGQIASSVSSGHKKGSPLTAEMKQLVKLTAYMAVGVGVVLFIIGMIISPVFIDNFVLFIGIFVAFVPQGIPATVTMLLTLAAEKLRDINVLVKDLHAVDTLGTITLLATDKTGTLTMNRMTVVELFINGSHYSTEKFDNNDGHHDDGNADTTRTSKPSAMTSSAPLGHASHHHARAYSNDIPNAQLMRLAFILCSSAYYHSGRKSFRPQQDEAGGGHTEQQEGEEERKRSDDDHHHHHKKRSMSGAKRASAETGPRIAGDATETGLLRFAAESLGQQQGVAPEECVESTRHVHRNVLNLPFDSSKKWSLSIVRLEHANGVYTLFLKGAPERVLAKCSDALNGGGPDSSKSTLPVDDAYEKNFTRAYEAQAAEGQRVIGVAMFELPGHEYPEHFEFLTGDDANFPQEGYTFVGLVGLRDPPKPGVADAVTKCREAKIKVVMVTGDHPLTAAAIAKQVGIIRLEDAENSDKVAVMHGSQLDGLSNRQWDDILQKDEIVFARTSPQHKLEIVVRLQALGHCVGVTGDGVNDSPALKRADMGISMAISGNDVSKEAASIILLDDNFSSVVAGIREGRLVFTNLKKCIMYTLTHITPEVIPFLLFIVLGLPAPINSFLILMIDLGTELGPAISYSREVAEKDIMNVPPRKSVRRPKKGVAVERSERKSLESVPGVRLEEVDIDRPEHQGVAHRLGYFWFRLFQWRVKDKGPGDERLVDRKLLSWSYLQAGMLITGVCLAAYFLEMSINGVPANQLLNAGRNYFTSSAGDFTTNDGTVYTQSQQMKILHQAQAAYFLSLVIMQCCFTSYLCHSTARSICGKQYFANWVTYVAAAGSICFAFFIVYTPGLNWILQAHPIHLQVLICPLVGGFVYILLEGIRRQVVFSLADRRKTKKAQQLEKERMDVSSRRSKLAEGGAPEEVQGASAW